MERFFVAVPVILRNTDANFAWFVYWEKNPYEYNATSVTGMEPILFQLFPSNFDYLLFFWYLMTS